MFFLIIMLSLFVFMVGFAIKSEQVNELREQNKKLVDRLEKSDNKLRLVGKLDDYVKRKYR